MRSLGFFTSSDKPTRQPWGLKWRSSVWFITLIVGFGIATDLFAYAVIIPVVPFRLEALGYTDASARTGWLLFAYSGGLAVSTPPIAWYSERHNARRSPLLFGLVCLIGAQIMFMLAPVYWLMALARIIQGVSSTFVWTVGLALICDTTPESRIGQQLGLAMTGLSAGVVLAPPIGGSLYQKLGFHAPFIFSIGIVMIDLLGRLLVIERKDAVVWGVDPAAETPRSDPEQEANSATEDMSKTLGPASLNPPAVLSSLAAVRRNPVVLIDVNGRPLVVDASETKSVFGNSSSLDSCEQRQRWEQEAESAFATPAEDHQLHPSSSHKSLKKTSPVVFVDLGGRLTVVERKEPASWADREESLKRVFCSSEPESHASGSIAGASPELSEKMELDAGSPGLPQSETIARNIPSEKPQLTSMQVLSALCLSSRALAAFANTLIFGMTYSSQEPTFPLRLQDPYGLSSLKVGLIYIASSVPTLASGALAGYLSDRRGTGLITIICLLMSVPWFIVMAIHGPLALVVVGAVLSNFFISAVVAPLTAELAAVTRQLPGVGYSHVYGAFNLAYGIGSALGPLIGGQLYDNVENGWTAVVGLAAGLMLVAATIAFVYADDVSMAKRLVRRISARRSGSGTTAGLNSETLERRPE